jgi:hypothetical protein
MMSRSFLRDKRARYVQLCKHLAHASRVIDVPELRNNAFIIPDIFKLTPE